MMKKWLSVLALTLSASAFAHGYKVGDIEIGHPWARATPAMSKNGGAYLTLHNMGKGDDALVSARGDIADKVELHTHLNDNGVMRMREVARVPVAAGQETALKPGSYHIMLIGLKKPLVEGERFPLVLTFDKAGEVKVEVVVDKVGAMGPAEAGAKHGDAGQMH